MINNIKVKVENILNSVSETLFDNKGLKDILEVTYIYKDNFNITLFSDFAGLSKESSYTELVDITGQKLGNVTSKIDSIINKINNGDNGEDKEILLGYLYYMKNLLDITILGLPFEAKKSTGIIELKNEEILNRIKKIEKLENKVFGGLVKDNSFEVTKSHQYINNLLAKSSNKISENEFMFMNIILSKIRSLEAYDHNIKSEKSDNINQKESIIPDIDINRDDYVKIFKLILNIYDIKKDIIISNVANMYDGDNGIEVPNNEKYKSIKLEKVLKMIAHELETHGIILDNNEHILGAIKGGGQLPREEGLAKIAEGMLEGRSINDFRNISFSLPEILAGEILSAEEYEKFIDIYLKLTGKNKIYSTKDRILRRKRNYPINYTGVQHKDTTYSRGLIQIVDYISQGGHWEDLYTAKVNFDDIPKAKHIKDKKHIKTKYPKLLSEVILYKLNHGKLDKNKFLSYLNNKYKGFLSGNDISDINTLNYSQKKQLVEILSIIDKSK